MTVEKYTVHLITSPVGNCSHQAGDVLEVGHDHFTWLVNKRSYTGKDLFDKTIIHLDSGGGTISVDNLVLTPDIKSVRPNI